MGALEILFIIIIIESAANGCIVSFVVRVLFPLPVLILITICTIIMTIMMISMYESVAKPLQTRINGGELEVLTARPSADFV